MSRTLPRSVRFEPDVDARLRSYVADHPGVSGSSVANRFVDEALRMHEHPGIFFRDGATGRRAVLVGGPDVSEVIGAVRSARHAEPDLHADEVLEVVSANTGMSQRLVRIAIRYWSAYPDEIDHQVELARQAEREHQLEWEREQELLSK